MKWILALFVALTMLSMPVAQAQSWAPDAARDARQSGDIIPLRDIIQRIKRERGGRHLDAQLFSKPGGGSEYHIDWEKDGRKFLIVVDAQTGRVIRSSRG